MPVASLVDRGELQSKSRRRRSDTVVKEREAARQLLRQAREGDKAIELTLAPAERDETIKARYRIIAKEEQARVRFHTAKHRSYRNRAGREEDEAEVLYVFVE